MHLSNQKANKAQPDAKLSPAKQNRYTCVGCRIKFDSGLLQRDHFKTEWHLYNLKRRVCNLDPIDNDSFNVIQNAAPKIEKGTKSKIDSRVIQQQSKQVSRAEDSKNRDDGAENDDDDWEEVEDDALLDEDYDDEEAAEMLARVIKAETCLFCDKKSATAEANIQHMNMMHGFFIPEEQYLIDMEGLMEYLGFKVGAGCTCLWCNKQFTTVHGVRLHMAYKDHCKIMYDQEKAVDEFKEFYDYSTQEHIKMKPLNQLAIPKKRSQLRSDYNRQMATKAKQSANKELIGKKSLVMVPGSYQAKNIKKFNAYRAKILLRTGMANNYSMRGRLRQQNPM